MLFGHVVPAAALEWLVNPPERSAAPDALKQLAVISALRKCKATESKWGVPAEVLESQWGLSPPSLGAELLALQAAGRCLALALALALGLALALALALAQTLTLALTLAATRASRRPATSSSCPTCGRMRA